MDQKAKKKLVCMGICILLVWGILTFLASDMLGSVQPFHPVVALFGICGGMYFGIDVYERIET